MDYSIKLTVKEKLVTDELPKLWYAALKKKLPSGVMTTIRIGDKQTVMKSTVDDNKKSYEVPLTRNLNKPEVEKVIAYFTEQFSDDFSINATTLVKKPSNEIAVKVEYDAIMEICEKWSKKQHDEWYKEKIDSGWRYGTTVSAKDKTHPLLKAWNELPEKYKKVDMDKPKELIEFFNSIGYLLVSKEDVDKLFE